MATADAKQLFNWRESFLTGIDSVDTQHHRLVDLINDLALMAFDQDEAEVRAMSEARDMLLDYSREHFADEEALMHKVGLGDRCIDAHVAQHAIFIDEIRALDLTQSGDSLQAALRFLMGWLAHHILGIDQGMARAIKVIESGVPADAALAQEQARRRSSSDPLLEALNVMLQVVSQRNQELRRANRELEQRVAERTAELSRSNQQLQVLAVQDELTGLSNRRFALAALGELWGEASLKQRSLSVLMLDADKFKQVNDVHGHAEGDALLRELAKRLRHAVRTSDIVCRLGGDEFLVICPDCNADGARRVAANILDEAQPYHNAQGEQCWGGALSIGVAEMQPSMQQVEQLLEAADLALYGAKRAGGRRQG